MAIPRYRAWRFVHPDYDVPVENFGLRNSTTGGIEMVEAEASVRQAILLLLSTMPGERVMRPGYGCDLARLVFSPNDETTHGLAMHYVRSALQRWETRIDILRLDAGRSEVDPALMEITLEYRVRRTRRADLLTIPFKLAEGQV
jgi:hypothetical protein